MHILAISGSLRKGSHNTALLRAAQKLLPPGVTMELALIDVLPVINTDLIVDTDEGARFPPSVERFRMLVKEADAILLSIPEYNWCMAAPLKNAIDWASVPKPRNEWQGKPAAMVSVGGTTGGIKGQQSLRASNGFLDMHLLNTPRLALSLKEDAPFFNEDTGALLDPRVEARLKSVVEALVDWATFLQTRGK